APPHDPSRPHRVLRPRHHQCPFRSQPLRDPHSPRVRPYRIARLRRLSCNDAGMLLHDGVAHRFPLSVSHSCGGGSGGTRWADRRLVRHMKIGLLAMSGVRAHDPELTALGLTLPGFVERNRVIASLPSLGLLTLAGATPGDVELEYIDVPDVHDAPWLPGQFDAVAISSFSAQIKEAYELADRYRAVGTKVTLGGLHVSVLTHTVYHTYD